MIVGRNRAECFEVHVLVPVIEHDKGVEDDERDRAQRHRNPLPHVHRRSPVINQQVHDLWVQKTPSQLQLRTSAEAMVADVKVLGSV